MSKLSLEWCWATCEVWMSHSLKYQECNACHMDITWLIMRISRVTQGYLESSASDPNMHLSVWYCWNYFQTLSRFLRLELSLALNRTWSAGIIFNFERIVENCLHLGMGRRLSQLSSARTKSSSIWRGWKNPAQFAWTKDACLREAKLMNFGICSIPGAIHTPNRR